MKQKISFEKYQATGNDFIIIDNQDQTFNLSAIQIEKLCHRRYGIGADGLILLEKSRTSLFKMKYYNSDGYEGTFCGNGSRSIVSYAKKIGLANRKISFEASDGIHTAELLENNLISISMNDVTDITEFDDGYFLHTGSPHFIRVVDNLNKIDVYKLGKQISRDNRFYTKSTNVNFIELDNENIKIATFERGVEDETYSCGTGSIAAALVVNKYFHPDLFNINIISKGGELKVAFSFDSKIYNNIKLIGPAVNTFSGSFHITQI
jgi:diaminopimelate epimerase